MAETTRFERMEAHHFSEVQAQCIKPLYHVSINWFLRCWIWTNVIFRPKRNAIDQTRRIGDFDLVASQSNALRGPFDKRFTVSPRSLRDYLAIKNEKGIKWD